jgi:hypothetical protein
MSILIELIQGVYINPEHITAIKYHAATNTTIVFLVGGTAEGAVGNCAAKILETISIHSKSIAVFNDSKAPEKGNTTP